MKWVTRDHVHMDRVAASWLIRRFIDREAESFASYPFAVLPAVAAAYPGRNRLGRQRQRNDLEDTQCPDRRRKFIVFNKDEAPPNMRILFFPGCCHFSVWYCQAGWSIHQRSPKR
jgi:ChrB, C-terminal domain